MLVIPAIDIRGGHCVRLYQGKMEQEEIYSKEPVFIAKLWQTQGAKRLHIVDLDGAFSGVMQNYGLVEKIKNAVNIPIEIGGGIRNTTIIRRLIKLGIDRIILGTSLVYNPKLLEKTVKQYKEKIMVSLDVSNGKIAIAGWKEVTTLDVNEVIPRIKELGIREIIYTDVKKDGTLEGPNFEGIRQICQVFGQGVIACGGISTIDDIKRLKEFEPLGLVGIIIGKALYTEKIKLDEAIKIGES